MTQKIANVVLKVLLLVSITHLAWLGFGRLPAGSDMSRAKVMPYSSEECRPYERSMEVWVPGGEDMVERLEASDIVVCD